MNIYEVGNYVNENGWAMPGIPKYPGLHLTVIPNNIAKIPELIKLLKKGMQEVRANPGKYTEGPSKLLTEIQSIPGSLSRTVLEECYHEIYEWRNYDAVTQEAKKTKQKNKKKGRK